MNYLDWSEYKQGWIFRHRELPVGADALAEIRPLAADSALQIWRQYISKEATHATHFLGDDWPARNGIWTEQGNWQEAWDSDSNELPELIAAHMSWDDNTVVYFCYSAEHVVQTCWKVFREHWKNFLFFDDEPFLIGKKRQQVACFHSDGSFNIGMKPDR
ncbi:MAG: hypothetical protein CMI03_19115 [Oceanospirillaceae bacterium]|uniref:DUF2947 domain-containing protein n=1 Tax=unclassified Thalassolituus TaxID=2624967 RepID=UPI000C3D5AFB|nr:MULTISPECIES: DUF2947 domain-containing protein [unclassified Thalassolituus]MAS24427.1 hypothetical protein [Oceanospirillaceae bacterium]MBL35363.1 hypothetical protein [Oceanospirillaceae bacterium]MBS54854.1 hypothetical protein [Oceanospirillaceae bacterium]|tara:strand:- start:993 stop:1472 length:480 start_codon:yes stop_codon:yes gene_type:complete